MGDYHFICKDLEGSTTQWDDIQTKLGSLPPKPPAFKPLPFSPSIHPDSIPKDISWINSKTHEDLDDDRFLQQYRYSAFSGFKISYFFHVGCFSLWLK